MNTISKCGVALGAAATLALSLFATAPATAAPAFVRHAQMHHAARLDRRAAHAAYTGHYRRAARLRRQATHLRVAARHGH